MSFASTSPRPGGSSGAPMAPVAPHRPSTADSIASSRSSVRSALANFKHATRVSGKTPQELLSQSDAAASRRMLAGKNHTFRRVRRDFLPEIPEARDVPQKPRTTRAQAKQRMAERQAKKGAAVAPVGERLQEDRSEYRREYTPKKADHARNKMGLGTFDKPRGTDTIEPVPRHKRPSELGTTGLGMGGELRGDTTSRDEFPGHVAPPPSGRGKVPWKPSAVGLQGEPESHGAYKGGGEPAKRVKPRDKLHLTSGPLDGTTTAGGAYVHHKDARPSDRYVPPSTTLANSKFVGVPESARSYPGHEPDGAGRRDPSRAGQGPSLSGVLGGGRGGPMGTTYGDAGGDLEGADDLRGDAPGRRRNALAETHTLPKGGHADMSTTSGRAYRGDPGEGRTPRRVRGSELGTTGLGMGGELRGDTTSRDEFPGHVAPPPSGRGKVPWKPSAVGLQGEPESHGAYKGGGEPAKRVKPRDKLHLTSGPLDGTTTAGGAYVHHKDARPSDRYVPPSTTLANSKFVGVPEGARQFVAKPVPKPPNRHVRPEHERDREELVDRVFLGATEYGDHLGAAIEDDVASVDSRGFVY